MDDHVERERHQAEALKANLRRRKSQARRKAAPAPAGEAGDASSGPKNRGSEQP